MNSLQKTLISLSLLLLSMLACITTSYTTSDGQNFDNRTEAEAHETMIQVTMSACAYWEPGQNPYAGECTQLVPNSQTEPNAMIMYRNIDFCQPATEPCQATDLKSAVEMMKSEITGNYEVFVSCTQTNGLYEFTMTIDDLINNVNGTQAPEAMQVVGINDPGFCDNGSITFTTLN